MHRWICGGSRGEVYYFFFFSSRRRHTRLQGDWSSDVCSSDLGSGKSTIGRQLARLWSMRFVDSDHVIEQRLGCSIREFFERERSEEHTSELQSPCNLVCRLLLEKKKKDTQ